MSQFSRYKEGDLFDPLNKRIQILIQSFSDYIVFIDELGFVQYMYDKADPESIELVLKAVAEMESLPNKHLTPDQSKYLQSLLGESVASALGAGKSETALDILKVAKEFLEETCKQNVKIWLLRSSFIVLVVSILVSVVIKSVSCQNVVNHELMSLLVVAFWGAIGAFISIFFRSNQLTANFYSTKNAIYYEGAFRVIYGVLSALIILLGIKSNLILGFLNQVENESYFLYFIAAISGASERMVPYIINNVESKLESDTKNENT